MSRNLANLRGVGNTDSERFLKLLCDRSFLSLWSHAGVYNDKGPGQEICDVLVLFGNHVVIFSDKNIAFPKTDDVALAWKRWYKRAIAESAKQLFGAERWITNFPNRLFLDQACKEPFPFEVPASDDLRIHRVVVTHSIAEHSKKYFNGGSGSLMFDSECVADEIPFTVGLVGDKTQFVHVLDDTSLVILLNTLDTTSDLIMYFERKEKFVLSGLSVAVAGEEEFLGHYLEFVDQNNDHDFLIGVDTSGYDQIVFEEGFWDGFSKHERRKLQIDANRVSYFWDQLIENLSKYVIEGKTWGDSDQDLTTQERLLRLLAKENRTRRRLISEAFLDFKSKTSSSHRGTRVVAPSTLGDPFYVFFVIPFFENDDETRQRAFRRELLVSYCAFVKLDHPKALDIVGIATESGSSGPRSYDFVYLNTRLWSEEDRRSAEVDRNELQKRRLFGGQEKFEGMVYEYPPIPSNRKTEFSNLNIKGRHRNQTCT